MGSEFVSKLEEIMEAKELPVGRSVAFGKYRQFFPEEAVKHPAKMDVNLLEYLIRNYTREGDTVLDPMAGTCSTCVLASLFGRNSICVELEPWFVEWGLEAKRIVEKAQSLTPKGRITVLQGDARELSKLLRSVDNIITSPPYEGSLEGTTRHTRGGIASRDPALAQTGTYATTLSFGPPVGYSSNKNNIGNMKKETYLEAMLKVYGEMFAVLRPGGRAIIVVKPFIRDKRVVDLPFQTWLLLERVGFRLAEVLKFRLQQMSFWRTLYYKRFSEVPIIAHEYVLVVEKAAE